MQHNILGEISADGNSDEGLARITYQGRIVEFQICGDEIHYEAAVEVAASVATSLAELDAKAKRIAADQLIETYNSGWNEYDEVQADGTSRTVSNPKLTRDQFAAKLTLSAVNVTGNMVDFFYNDENMFWGHAVVVNSRAGIDLTDAYAEIFG